MKPGILYTSKISEAIKIVPTFDYFSNKMLAMPLNLLELLNFPRIIAIGHWRNATNLLVSYKILDGIIFLN